MPQRSFKLMLLALGMAFGLGGSMSSALAQTAATQTPAATVSNQPSTTTATYGDWVLRCVSLTPQSSANSSASGAAAGESCEVVLTVQVQGQTQPIAQLAIGHLPNQTELIMTVVLPVNISIPGKVHISSNAKSGADEKGGVDLAWKRCLPAACFAETMPSKDVLNVMRAEANGQLQFMDASGRAVALPLSWHGLTQALAALK